VRPKWRVQRRRDARFVRRFLVTGKIRLFIILNGPLGIGKSTLAEALTESIDHCVMLSGDLLVAVNPSQPDELQHLHSTIALLVGHHLRFGYRHFVIEHFWSSSAELADLRDRLARVDLDAEFRAFVLTLPEDENLRRIERRQVARAIDEHEFERRTVAIERDVLTNMSDPFEPFDVSAAPRELVAEMLRRLGMS
jgi:hypothetical protein